MSELREVLDEHFWHPPVPNPEHPMHRGGCYCGWQCKRIFGESRIDQYIDHLHEAILTHLAEASPDYFEVLRNMNPSDRLKRAIQKAEDQRP